jgi:hypothetical protein
MSLANKTDVHQMQGTRDSPKPQSRGFLLALVCMVIFVALAKLVFPPITGGNGHAVWLIGP